MSPTKIREIKYLKFKTQPYLKSHLFTQDMKGLLFSLRSSMTRNIKQIFSSLYKPNLQCKINCEDSNAVDSQPHLLQCKELAKLLSVEENSSIKGVKYEDIFGSLEEHKEVVVVMARLLEVREEQLEKEILPVGTHTGPDSTVISVVLVK